MDEGDLKPGAKASPDDDAHTKECYSSGSTTPNKKVKPALKKDDHLTEKEKKHLKWDEEAIVEHDLLRGTRMKIDEPNTPYAHYDSGAESDDSRRPKSPANQKATLSWDVLETRLNSVAAVRDAYPSSPSDSHGGADHSDVEDDRKKEMRNLEFKEHRKRHYNEMELVRRFRQEHPGEPLAVEGDANGEANDAADDDDEDDSLPNGER